MTLYERMCADKVFCASVLSSYLNGDGYEDDDYDPLVMYTLDQEQPEPEEEPKEGEVVPHRCKCGGVAAGTILQIEGEEGFELVGVSCMKCGKTELISVNANDPVDVRVSAWEGTYKRWNRRMADGTAK